MTELNLAYIAGIIDGEGSIMLLKTHATDMFKKPYISVTSTSFEIIDFLQSMFPGTVCNQKVYKQHHKPSRVWKLSYDKAIDFLTQVYPYLKENSKRHRANLIISEYKTLTKRNGMYSKDEIKAKLDFESRFHHPSNSSA